MLLEIVRTKPPKITIPLLKLLISKLESSATFAMERNYLMTKEIAQLALETDEELRNSIFLSSFNSGNADLKNLGYEVLFLYF